MKTVLILIISVVLLLPLLTNAQGMRGTTHLVNSEVVGVAWASRPPVP